MTRRTVASLPGPRRYLDTLAADLDDGFSCVWMVPDDIVDRGIADDLLRELTARVDGVRVPAPEIGQMDRTTAPPPTRPSRSAASSPEWATDRFGLLDLFPAAPRPKVTTAVRATRTVAERMLSLVDLAPEHQDDPLARVVASEWLRGKVIVLPAWDEPDAGNVGSVVVRFAAIMKEAATPLATRPRLLAIGREKDLPGSALERVDPVTARVHWWWGGIGRLDTAVVVATARPMIHRAGLPFDATAGQTAAVRDLVFIEVVVEVAGPDLVLAERLASTWDGRMATLPDRIKEFVALATGPAVPIPRRWRGARDRPPTELRQLWASGLADLWDSEVRISPVAKQIARPGEDLDRLIWRGQNRALTPVVDRWRAYLEEKVQSRASMAVLDELMSEDGWEHSGKFANRPVRTTLELNRMAWAVRTGRVRLNSADTAMLFCLRDVRNSLAHLTPLTDDGLRRLAQILPEEAW